MYAQSEELLIWKINTGKCCFLHLKTLFFAAGCATVSAPQTGTEYSTLYNLGSLYYTIKGEFLYF